MLNKTTVNKPVCECVLRILITKIWYIFLTITCEYTICYKMSLYADCERWSRCQCDETELDTFIIRTIYYFSYRLV